MFLISSHSLSCSAVLSIKCPGVGCILHTFLSSHWTSKCNLSLNCYKDQNKCSKILLIIDIYASYEFIALHLQPICLYFVMWELDSANPINSPLPATSMVGSANRGCWRDTQGLRKPKGFVWLCDLPPAPRATSTPQGLVVVLQYYKQSWGMIVFTELVAQCVAHPCSGISWVPEVVSIPAAAALFRQSRDCLFYEPMP